jgi:hypothetical protein
MVLQQQPEITDPEELSAAQQRLWTAFILWEPLVHYPPCPEDDKPPMTALELVECLRRAINNEMPPGGR